MGWLALCLVLFLLVRGGCLCGGSVVKVRDARGECECEYYLSSFSAVRPKRKKPFWGGPTRPPLPLWYVFLGRVVMSECWHIQKIGGIWLSVYRGRKRRDPGRSKR